jgi:phosphopantothenoylcysteine synthetase/decarboxylase
MRPILLVGGAPRVTVDAVRFLSVAASGATATQLRESLHHQGLTTDLLLGIDASPAAAAERYADRDGLEAALKRWIAVNPTGVVVMSAAVNDYRVAQVVVEQEDGPRGLAPGAKLPSRAGAVTIRLEPASKVIDQLRGWGLAGPIVGFKYEARETVLASAAALQARVGAALVVANSLCGQLQALVDERGPERFPDRPALVEALGARLGRLARL